MGVPSEGPYLLYQTVRLRASLSHAMMMQTATSQTGTAADFIENLGCCAGSGPRHLRNGAGSDVPACQGSTQDAAACQEHVRSRRSQPAPGELAAMEPR